MAVAPLTDILGPVMAALSMPLLVGAQHLAEHDAPPKIVWVPSEDDWGEGAHQGGRTVKAVYVCGAGFDVYVWDVTHDAVRELRRRLLVAAHSALAASFRIVSSGWVGFDRPDWLRDGEAWRLRCLVQEPITTEPWTTVTPEGEGFDSSGAVQGDGLLDAGEST